MTPEAVLQQVGGAAALEDVQRGWEPSMAALPQEGPEFLRDSFWQEYSRWCGFGAELDGAFGRVATAVRNDPALCAWPGTATGASSSVPILVRPTPGPNPLPNSGKMLASSMSSSRLPSCP